MGHLNVWVKSTKVIGQLLGEGGWENFSHKFFSYPPLPFWGLDLFAVSNLNLHLNYTLLHCTQLALELLLRQK